MRKLLQTIGKIFNLVVLSEKEYKELTTKPPTVSEPTKPTTLLNYKKIVTMLSEYDKTRLKVLVKNLGFEDTRINTFDFVEVKNYLAYTEALATEKGIKLKGLSFVKGTYTKETAHNEDSIGYENLMYLPTAMVNGKETQIDLLNSSRGNIVSFKDMLAKNGYKWRYDNADNFITKATSTNTSKKQITNNTNETQFKAASSDSVVANRSHISPPREA